MEKTEKKLAAGVTAPQLTAIGQMAVEFNWLEHTVESLIECIICPADIGVTESVVRRMGFRQKLDNLKDLVDAMPDHLTSEKAERRYKGFAAEIKELRKAAYDLNDFRNDVIHFRGNTSTEKTEVMKSAAEIEQKAHEMQDLGIKFIVHAINLRDDDTTITFVGNHDRLKAEAAGSGSGTD